MLYLLSPASASGKRAQRVARADVDLPLARALRAPGGAPIGEVFEFLSGLYFRGKLAYARAFGEPGGVFVITPTRGLVPAEHPVTLADLAEFASVNIASGDARYRKPLARDAQALAARTAGDVVLLGSIATGKYVDELLAHFGERLRFPAEFVGRGDMSRGGLMLRAVRAGEELATVPVLGAARHGKRPDRLVR